MKTVCLFLVALAIVAQLAHGKIYFEETFDDASWEERWVVTTETEKELGEWALTAGEFAGDEADQQGIQTSEDARHYAISTKLAEAFDNKDKDLVFQYTAKMPSTWRCGGAYIKALPEGVDQASFGGDSEYAIMFGPDRCATTKRTHAIINYEGENHLIKDEVEVPTDDVTHAYTFILHPDNTYEIRIDGETKQEGNIADGWDVLAPREIPDPSDTKPADWVDEPMMDDPEDVKPADWDNEPETIADPDAEQPADWDVELDGEWEAPQVPNPEFKGEWRAKKIANPDYKGPWVQKTMANPDFVDDEEIYHYTIGGVGIEVWQVEAGSVIDNILITDSVADAEAHLQEHFFAHVDAEKAAKEEYDAEKAAKAAAEAEAAKAAAEAAAEEEDDAEDEEEAHDEL